MLANIRSAFFHRYRISSDIFIDALGAKTIFDALATRTNAKINGYISSIGLNPFGFLLFSEIQVISEFSITENLKKMILLITRIIFN